jgi:hypothetical protein
MNAAIKLISRSILVLVGVLALAAGNARGADVETLASSALPVEAREALGRFEKAFESVQVEYVESQSGTDFPKYCGGPLVCTEQLSHGRFDHTLNTIYLNEGKPQPTLSENTFDGEVVYMGPPKFNPPQIPTILTTFSPLDPPDPRRFEKVLYFSWLDAMGAWTPECIADVAEPLFRLSSRNWVADGHLEKTETVDGKLVLTLRVPDRLLQRAAGVDAKAQRLQRETTERMTPDSKKHIAEQEKDTVAMQHMAPRRLVKLWLDPEHSWAPGDREERTDDGKLILTVHSTD